MEPDISILRKTGHFYFALTRTQIMYVLLLEQVTNRKRARAKCQVRRKGLPPNRRP
jgi:hypothetical protein